MTMKKGFVFVAILVIVSSKVCTACFIGNEYEEYTGTTGSTYVKHCFCKEVGYSAKHLTWLGPDGNVINGLDTSNPNVYTEIQEQYGIVSLIVRSISKSMSGNYTCQTNFEGNVYNQTYNIEAYDSPYFVNTSKVQNIIIGENSLVRCEVRGIASYEIVWYRVTDEADVLLNNDEKYTILAGHGLLINNVTTDDEGSYNCTVNNIVIGDSKPIQIIVQAVARPVIFDPKFNIPPEIITVNNTVIVECVAEGRPYPEYTWTKITDQFGNKIENATPTWTQVVNTIKFDSIQKEDAGTYVCTAENTVDSVFKNISIGVRVPPVILPMENVTFLEGSVALIACQAIGVPAPRLLIETSQQGLEDDERIATVTKQPTPDTSELYLTIMNVSRTHEGVFKCSAANDVDNVTQEIYMTVYYPPHFQEQNETLWGWLGSTVNMSCAHDSNPPSSIVWKFLGNDKTTTAEHDNGNQILYELTKNSSEPYLALPIDSPVEFGEYECIAINSLGNTTKKIYLREAFTPDLIKNATNISLTATSVTFWIQGPDSPNNAPLHGYVAEYDLVEKYDTISHHESAACGLDRNLTIDHLIPNSTYLIKFAAQNAVGNGNYSEPIKFVTPESSAPAPPANVWATKDELRWNASEPNNAPIDHYQLEFKPFFGDVLNGSLVQEEIVPDTAYPLDKLERNTKYQFRVRAHNKHGYSNFKEVTIWTPVKRVGLLSASAVIGISVVVVILCILVMDLLLLCWRRQGMIASCFFRKSKKKEDNLNSRDEKGLLVKKNETTDDRPNNGGHRELVYNKTTGVITGKHSSV